MRSEIKAVIFDMDGVLVDSEPFWQQAELEVLPRYGVPLTPEDPLKTQGLRIDHVVEYWYQRHPWPNADIQGVSDEILTAVIELVSTQGVPLPGVLDSLAAIQAAGLPLGLATSSPSALMHATLERLGIRDFFAETHSAEHLALGKPHPEIYLNTAAALDVAPQHCLAIEDSFNGLLAAKAARMQVLAVPDAFHRDDPRFVIADALLPSLSQFRLAHWLG